MVSGQAIATNENCFSWAALLGRWWVVVLLIWKGIGERERETGREGLREGEGGGGLRGRVREGEGGGD